MKLSNADRTSWIQSQAVGDEKPTDHQTGTILQGSQSLVYLGVTGKGLQRPFRIHFGLAGPNGSGFPYYVGLEVFSEQFSDFSTQLVHWTKVLHQIRETNARYKVSRVFWGADFRDGSSFAKWDRIIYDDRYRVTSIHGDPFLEELSAIPEEETETGR